jgi:GDP-L-fucose synthase
MGDNFWENKKVLITGGKGFLGSFLVPKIKEKGAEVFVFGKKDYDLRNEKDIEKMFEDIKPEIVIHMAVDGGGIRYMEKNPGSVFDNNILMNTFIQKYARENGVKKFVGIGTVCEYPKFTKVPFKEEDLWKGYPEETNATYGLSKKMMLVQSQGYKKQYGFDAIHLLLVNLYGPNDDFDLEDSHVIPAFVRKFIEAKEQGKEEVILWGTGKASRELLYVEDCAEAIIKATKSYNESEPINIGAGEEITMLELAKKVKEIVGYPGKIVWDTSRPDGQPRRGLDVSKAKEKFGFEAKTNLDEGLKKTIEWYKNRTE